MSFIDVIIDTLQEEYVYTNLMFFHVASYWMTLHFIRKCAKRKELLTTRRAISTSNRRRKSVTIFRCSSKNVEISNFDVNSTSMSNVDISTVLRRKSKRWRIDCVRWVLCIMSEISVENISTMLEASGSWQNVFHKQSSFFPFKHMPICN